MHSEPTARISVLRKTAAALGAAILALASGFAAAAPNLAVDKTPNDGTVAGGSTAAFTIVLSNLAPADVQLFDVELVDPLPGAGLIDWEIESETQLFGCNIEGDFPAQETLVCDPGSIFVGQSETVVVSGVTPDTCMVLANTATATAEDAAGSPYSPVADTGSITVTSDTCRPLFVIGDVEPHAVGDEVNFWGAQWWKNNFMSGLVSSGVASFKGYASDADPDCGGTWETRPGNSSKPPKTIPDNVIVIVTDTVQKDGPDITGNITQLLLVASDGGYGPNPGHRGNGTVLQVLCPLENP